MKLDARAVERFLGAPDLAQPVVLLHGPDAGLVGERATRLARTVLDDPGDPFRLSELPGESLAKAPERLSLEAQSLCLLGGRRVVRVRQAGEGCRAALQELLALPAIEALVLVEADELPASSKLRQLAERSARAAVIACYRETGRQLEGSLRDLLKEHGLELQADAFAYLANHLGADRGISRREIEKLALFMADGRGAVHLDDVTAVIGDASALALDDLIYAALGGDPGRSLALLGRLISEGVAPIRILRAVAGTVLSLYRMRVRMAGGETADAVLASLRPPPHFSVRDRLRAALMRHAEARLEGWLRQLNDTEIRCKAAKAPDVLLCRRLVLAIAREAQGPRSARMAA